MPNEIHPNCPDDDRCSSGVRPGGLHGDPVAKDFLLTKWGSAFEIELDDPDVAREVLDMFEKVD